MSLKVFFATVFVISQNHYDFLSSNWTFTKVLYQLSSQKCFLVNSSFLQNSFTDKAWNCFGNAFKYYLKRVVCVENWFLHSNLTIFKSVCFTKQFPEFYLKTLISINILLGTKANIILLAQTNYHNWLIISNTTFRSSCKPHRWSLTQDLITYTTVPPREFNSLSAVSEKTTGIYNYIIYKLFNWHQRNRIVLTQTIFSLSTGHWEGIGMGSLWNAL